ncbi:MAG: hypothetical protein U0172_02935 [Nitrospiraceae bacterium]
MSKLIAAHEEVLSLLSNDNDALNVFVNRVGPNADLAEVIAILRAPTRPDDPAAAGLQIVRTKAVAFMRALSRWNLAQALRTRMFGAAESRDSDLATARQKQIDWTMTDEAAPAWARLARLMEAVTWSRGLLGASAEHPTYDVYRAALDRAYPELAGGEQAWLTVIERGGAAAMQERLVSEAVGAPVPESVRSQMAARYVTQRLGPLLDGQAQIMLGDIERDAVAAAYREWADLRAAKDQVRWATGLARLCGGWQLTVHNHRNHSDSKTGVLFTQTGVQHAAQARPLELVMLGDAIYLRWEHPGGVIQEDSLLLVGEGRRLEGSFTATGGSWGSVTGKRVQACKP